MNGPADPRVRAMIDEANALPDCLAKDALLERAAQAAEGLGDLGTAYSARVRVLGSQASHDAPRFESLFLTMAWCLAQSDRDPARFAASDVLWQYKWVVTEAPDHAGVPRRVLERLIDDMEERMLREGWGPRAGAHKRVELLMALGEPAAAVAAAERWRALPRDRGSDCVACETSGMAMVYLTAERDADAVREARPIIRGRLSCLSVPHSTFGHLLPALTRLARHAEAKELYDRGRRLVAEKDEGAVILGSPYLLYAGYLGDLAAVAGMLRGRLAEAAAIRSEMGRSLYFSRAGLALTLLAQRHGVEEIEAPRVAGITEGGGVATAALGASMLEIARTEAAALDRRNGNAFHAGRITTLAETFGVRVES